VSERKQRLFACACVRLVSHLLTDERSIRAVSAAELLADGRVSFGEVSALHAEAAATAREAFAAHGMFSTAEHLAVAAAYTLARSGFVAFAAANRAAHGSGPLGMAQAQRWQCTVFRDIVGNPFRPTAVDSRWLTPSAVRLAQTIYVERAFDRLPSLAEALVTAGCENEEILGHCREAGPHVRGCWVIDLVLGKE
jgi:hypothetical protein